MSSSSPTQANVQAYLDLCHTFYQNRVAAHLAHTKVDDLVQQKRQAQDNRNRAADALDEAMEEYVNARKARRAAGEVLIALHTNMADINSLNEAAPSQKLIAALNTAMPDSTLIEAGIALTIVKLQADAISQQLQNASERDCDARLRFEKACAAKDEAQKALDDADAKLKAVTTEGDTAVAELHRLNDSLNIEYTKIFEAAETAFAEAVKSTNLPRIDFSFFQLTTTKSRVDFLAQLTQTVLAGKAS